MPTPSPEMINRLAGTNELPSSDMKPRPQTQLAIMLAAGVALFALGWTTSSLHAESQARRRLTSKIMSWDQARSHSDTWGEMRTYFTGESYGATNIFTAVAVVKPGESVHPAHRHGEEEFLVIGEGTGTWRLNGKESPAKRGDVLYAEPWAFHGLVNTGTEPLTFFVVRWSNPLIPPPAAPPGDNGK